ncbi:PaaI family thioesterase [Massilia sp. TS11]|uniref:PaaI family thioesterase n=1 Tax=Massilia sp. TS11 TaxID=2908003 RepID=UPI0022AACC74|nr:YiiD C-terminal domain-containing protein [Massilia sp. TS11]
MVYEKIRQQMMDTLPFVRLCGITIDAIGPGTATCSMPDAAQLHNHLHTPHAGALFTLAETASGAAMAGGFAELILEMRPVAKESRIQYQKVAKGATRAEGRVPGDLAALKAALKQEGKLAFPVHVDIYDAQDTLAAQVQVEWYLSAKR